jgi:hypothetical protein
MAAISVQVRDETTTGDVLGGLDLQLEAERTTVREIIRARVHQEVRDHNAKAVAGPFRGLVKPSESEAALNPAPEKRRRPRRIDASAQTDVAWSAFERGQILVLVDDRQLIELDEEVVLGSGSSVVFLKLVPLVGG